MPSLQNPEEIHFQKIPRSPRKSTRWPWHFRKLIDKLPFGRWPIFYSRGKQMFQIIIPLSSYSFIRNNRPVPFIHNSHSVHPKSADLILLDLSKQIWLPVKIEEGERSRTTRRKTRTSRRRRRRSRFRWGLWRARAARREGWRNFVIGKFGVEESR